ncbi:MAG: ABC transporter permease [Phycisphaeraceae bacterium]
MSVYNIAIIARKEVRDSLRNRWFWLYAGAFAVLALGLSYLSLAGTEMSGLAGFGRTTAGLVNLVLLIVPLMALNIAAASVAGERERGTLAYLLSQPVSRGEVLWGKYLGLAAALLAALAGGFGLSGAIIAWHGGAASAGSYALLVALTFVLALSMLSVGLLVSVLARKASVAIGVSIVLWLVLTLLSDLALMGSTIAFKLRVDELFSLALLNPLQVFKMSVLSGIHATLDVLGPAGTYARQRFGTALGAVFAVALGIWVIAPLVLAHLVFLRKGAA